MADKKRKTTLGVSVEVKDWINERGKKSETTDDILRRLLKIT